MPKVTISKNNFTAGEISPDLWGRADLQGYANGAARLRNVILRPTGGVTRRPGLRHVWSLPGVPAVRLASFSFNTEQTYLLVFSPLKLQVFRGSERVYLGDAPWTAEHLPKLSWTQSADTLFLCHPDLHPQRITRLGHGDWKIENFAFMAEKESGALFEPSFKFAKPGMTLVASGTSGTVTVTASDDFFLPAHVNTQLRIKKKAVRVDNVSTARSAQVTVLQALADTTATEDWEEAAFSPVRGWPVSPTLYQERLVFAGSRDLPNRIWMSKTSDIDNFDLGEALDDEGIEFALLTDQVDAIRSVVAGRHLQVFTTGAEWMVAGDPLTPTKARAERQTRTGSYPDRTIPPRHVDGATLFVARNGRELREFLYTDIDQSYTAADLALLSNHVFDNPVDQDYAARDRLFLIVMGDGSIAALTVYRAQQITAWTVFETAGAFRAIAVVEDCIYVAVMRNGEIQIEYFATDSFTDSHVATSSIAPQHVWGGLGHLNGLAVEVLADGKPQGRQPVVDGMITLAKPASRVEIGLPYTHEIRPLPVELGSGPMTSQGGPVRLVRAVFRLFCTKALHVDIGRGLQALPFARSGAVLDAVPEAFSGDMEVRGLGWRRGADYALWHIAQDVPQPCTLLSVITEVKGAD